MKTRSYKVMLCVGLLTASFPAAAQVPDLIPLNHQLRYDVAWNGLALGRVRLTVSEDQFRYAMQVDTKTRGVASLFSEEHSFAEVAGRVDEEHGYIAQKYESRTLPAKDGRITVITYDAEGKIKDRKRTPPDDPARRPVVPLEEAGTATDPITAFFLLRERMHDNIARNQRETKIRTYEGARLAEFTFKVISRARVEVNGEYVNAINIVPTRQPINGYKDKELKKFKDGDPTVHVYFSPDEKFIPLKAEANLSFGSITATLTEIKETK